MSLITLTTDFGEDSPYVAVMKGVILSINPSASIVDLTHQVPPHDVRHGAYFLATAIPYFPPRTVHVAVVDPGVGTERGTIAAEVEGQFIVGPDNGLFSLLFDRHAPTGVWRLTERRCWRPAVSATFHGRDIFAPVGAHLTLDPTPSRCGSAAAGWVRLPGDPWCAALGRLTGSVQFVDRFGNLISNVPGSAIATAPQGIRLGGRDLAGLRWVRTYGAAAPGDLVGLISSDGFVEVAVVNGSAADRFGSAAGDPVEVRC